MTTTQSMSIDDIFSQFLDEQRERLKDATFQRYVGIISLFRIYLNGYGDTALATVEDIERWEEASEEDEEAFCRMFGADEIVAGLPEFLDYFMIRKVMASQQELKAASTVAKKLVSWLRTQTLISDETASEGLEDAKAARELPAMEELAGMIHELGRDLTPAQARKLGTTPRSETIEDQLTISGTAPGKIYFHGLDGYVAVPRKASALAQPGWSIFLVLAPFGDQWLVLNSGNVYPH